MECPFCKKALTEIVNSRPTKQKSQVWRRRNCLNCGQTFTTHELIDLSHIKVVKKSGKKEYYSRMKLYSGIFYASQATKILQRELFIEKITLLIEKDLLALKSNSVNSSEIADIVLKNLKKKSIPTFLRFLTYCRNIQSELQMKKEIAKYI